MRNMKKLASLLLALTLVFALAIPAMAAETTGSITVENAKTGETYKAYKIFDVVYNDGKTAYAYSIKGNSEWFNTVKTYADVTTNGVTLTASAADNNVYIVETTNAFSPAKFAATLSSATTGKTGTELTISNGKATATGLDLGYYFVTTTTGALCNLTTTNPSASIYDKNDVPFGKTDDDESVEVGQVVNYTVTGKVPNTTGFTTFTYKIEDTMSAGLTFNKNVKVYIGNVEQTEHVTITYKADGNNLTDNQYVVSIDVMQLQTKVNQEIKLTYTATVNEQAVSKIENNNAVLTYSNNPADSTSTATKNDKETVYTAKIVIDKYETGNKNTKLQGAKFVLYKEVEGAKKYYKYDETADKVSWVDSITDATEVTTDANGAANFIGLEDGTYYLHETAAPAGYNLLKEDVSVTINGANATETDLSSLTATSKIANSTGSELPSTGGMGTTLLYTIGGILVLAAVVLLITKKRMSAAN